MCEAPERENGNEQWRELQWYPPILLFYAGGIAAIAGDRYDALFAMMQITVRAQYEDRAFVLAATEEFGPRRQTFKLLEGQERDKVPFSEHVYGRLQQLVGDVLFLGSDYERAFDRFELLYAIEYAHQANRTWAPVGRFVWRRSGTDQSPMQQSHEGSREGRQCVAAASGRILRQVARQVQFCCTKPAAATATGWLVEVPEVDRCLHQRM